MNFAASSSSNKPKKYGLNKRGTDAKKSTTNVFGNDSDSDDDDVAAAGSSNRAAVNRALSREQAALRKRAQAAAAAQEYDFDGTYEDTNNGTDGAKNTTTQQQPPQPKKSRYIASLLQTSQVRQQEREIIRERQIIREQNLEDLQSDYRDKDKFVTSAYQRQLDERQVFLAREAQTAQIEAANDVTKQKLGMANFYGNFSRNVAVGGGNTRNDDNDNVAPNEQAVGDDQPKTKDFTDRHSEQNSKHRNDIVDKDDHVAEDPRITRRALREKKVAEARKRYFERQGLQ